MIRKLNLWCLVIAFLFIPINFSLASEGLVLENQTYTSGHSEYFYNEFSVTAGPVLILESGADITLHGGGTVTLKPGFTAHSGSNLNIRSGIDSVSPQILDQYPMNDQSIPSNGEPVTVSTTYADSGSSIETVSFLDEFGNNITAQATLTDGTLEYIIQIPENRRYTYRIMITDKAGNTLDAEITFVVDNPPPQTVASVPGGDYAEPLTVDLSSSEPATIYYSFDGDPPTPGATNTFEGSSPIQGIDIYRPTQLQFFAVDLAGNTEETKSELYTILGNTPGLWLKDQTVQSGEILDYKADRTIKVAPNFVIESGGQLSLEAGSSVILKPGFISRAGGDLTVRFSDSDGLINDWEYEHFRTLAYGPSDDNDGDFLTNYEEFLIGTLPTEYDLDNDNDGLVDRWELDTFGSLKGNEGQLWEYAVTTGAATYDIPIEAPPGRNKMAPSLSLHYNSRQRNQWIGVGWRLDIGAIQRSSKNGVDYDADDYVYVGGLPFKDLVPRSDWGSDHYGAKIEGEFVKYIYDPETQGWEARTKQGKKYYFGTTDDSRQSSNAHGIFKWLLDKVQDGNGNYMTIDYFKDQGAVYPLKIEYTAHDGGNLSATKRVDFIYEDREDDIVDTEALSEIIVAKRLDKIEIYAGEELVRVYDLDYENGPISLLSQVTQYGTDGISSLPPIAFGWTDGPDGLKPHIQSIQNGLGATTTFEYTSVDTTSGSFKVPVVFSSTIDDGNGVVATATSVYSGGIFDDTSREFKGFASVEQTHPNGAKVETFYSTDDFRKAREYRSILKDLDGTTLTESKTNWEEITPESSWGFVRLNSKETIFDGDPNKFVLEEYEYDEAGNVLTKVMSGTGGETVTEDYTFEELGGWVWRANLKSVAGNVSGIVRETDYVYDSQTGNLLTKYAWGEDENGNLLFVVTDFGYDQYGNQTSALDPMGNETTTDYDSATNTYPVKVSNPALHEETYVYDERFGEVIEKTDPNGNLTYLYFDVFGRPTAEALPDGGRSDIEYFDFASPRYVVTRVKENETSTLDTFEYFDGLGRSIQKIKFGENGNSIVSRAFYDQMGHKSRVEGPFFGSGTAFPQNAPADSPYQEVQYDLRGREVSIESPSGEHGIITATLEYDGFASTAADPDGAAKTEIKDYLGRVIRVLEHTTPGDPSGDQITDYTYNAAGDLLTVTDAIGNLTTMKYDLLGRKTEMFDPDMGYWSYVYDDNGNMVRQTDANGQIITFSYDELNRIVSKSYSTGDSTITYTYDNLSILNGLGQIYSVENANGMDIVNGYDAMGRETSVTKTISGNTNSYTTLFTYDVAGKPKRITYPDAYFVDYQYYPGSGLLEKATGSDGTVFAEMSSYSPAGKIGLIDHNNGTSTIYNYNSRSTRLSSLQTIDTNQQVFQQRRYFYSPAGDVEQIDDENQAISFFYQYDALHRLTSETNTGTYDTSVFEFDPTGNITYKSDGPVHLSYSYNSGHAHAPCNITIEGVPYSYAYDANGNVITSPDFSDPFQVGSRNISYNADNMPVSISNTRAGETTTIDFVYDGDGKRIKKSVQGGTTIYYVGEHYEIQGGFPVRYVFAGNLRIAKMSAEGVHYFHKDHLRSSTVVTDAAGVQVEATEYLPFGARRTHSGISVSSYTYTDQEWDAETGFYNYDARLYDPTTGRFVTPDIYVQSPFDPQTLNRYAYARNNPLIYADADGHFFHLIVAFIAPVIADVVGSAVAANIIGGAIVGAAAGGAIAAATGGDVGMGMLTGAISGGAFAAAGGIIASSGPMLEFSGAAHGLTAIEQAGIHVATGAAVGGVNASLTGGDVGIGMLTGALSAGIGKYAGVRYLQQKSVVIQFVGYSSVGAVTGGITYTLYGGDFGIKLPEHLSLFCQMIKLVFMDRNRIQEGGFLWMQKNSVILDFPSQSRHNKKVFAKDSIQIKSNL